MEKATVLCPSSRCQEGAILVGLVLPNGRVAYSGQQIVVDREFVEVAHEGRSPEKRFRFAGPCAKMGCAQWTGSRCGVIDAILESTDQAIDPTDLPECSIRPQCRWFGQTGSSACAVCPEVITDLRVDATADDVDVIQMLPDTREAY